MSCSARLPVYVLLIGTFFPRHGSFVFVGLYLLGIIVAIITAKLLRRFFFKKEETPFVMELPPYRMPTAKTTLRHMWEKAAQYLRKMGGIILAASVVIWFLSYFPRYGQDIMQTATVTESFVVVHDVTEAQYDDTDEAEASYLQQQNSYIGRFGQFIAPVMEPLGFDWKISVGLVTGMAAKELIVSTLGVLYSDGSNSAVTSLPDKLRAPDKTTGEVAMTSATALSLLVFVLLYFPCIAAMVAIRRETGSWKWGLFSFAYNTLVAWVAAFIVYNAGSLLF
jgi:ferrous iron transport protein B